MDSSKKKVKTRSGGRPRKEYSQAVRLLRMMRALAGREWTIPELAEEFAITYRHVLRDLEQIRKAGFPLRQKREADGRTYYQLPLGHKGLPPLSLTAEELMSLFLAKCQLDSLKGTPFAEDLENLFRRIKAEQSDRTFNHLERIVKACVSFQRPTRDYSAQKEVLTALRTALLQQRRIILHYHPPEAYKPHTHEVDPYVLVLYRNGLYLIGHSHTSKAQRTFAIERIHKVEPTGERFEIPADFSAEAMEHRLFGILEDPSQTIRIRFSPDVAYLFKERLWHPTQTIATRKDRSLVLTMQAGGLKEVVSWVLSWGPHAKALAPAELVKEVKKELIAAVKQYSRNHH
jgi:proteasome accessory factor B